MEVVLRQEFGSACEPTVDIILQKGVTQRLLFGYEIKMQSGERVHADSPQEKDNCQALASALGVFALGAVEGPVRVLDAVQAFELYLGHHRTDSGCRRIGPYDRRGLEVRKVKHRGCGEGGLQVSKSNSESSDQTNFTLIEVDVWSGKDIPARLRMKRR